ncbi:hypothetical protein BDY21DRAFT_290868 [Lineolata rhizophorae]|uniref:Bul1 C-terminal domain-containing protein n=1 Tax=Lineolata rhizophorae TaxID=578093 RepID=A0A6A6NT21_9PEZI|nr:hypothetical protein BDY21DRAFT_290868 [Lineolata rhizophorae]
MTNYISAHSGDNMGYRVRNMNLLSKPSIAIELDNTDGYISSYSTLDRIEGKVHVTAPNDTRFDDIEISFIGQSKTFVEKFTTTSAMTGRTDATHRFLKLTQPIESAAFPEPRVCKAGLTYTFPFTFAVPLHLLPRACSHPVTGDHVRDAHLQLPPSLGDPELSGFGGALLDDFAPHMARITYAVHAEITRVRFDSVETIVAEKSRKVRIKPAFDELPPLSVDGGPDQPEYRLRQVKTIRKGVFKGKLGRLVMEATQPPCLRLPALAPDVDPRGVNISTMARVALRFDPARDDEQPPKLSQLSSKLKVQTFFSTTPRRNFPAQANTLLDMHLGAFSETVTLASRCVGATPWERHERDPGSGSFSSSSRCASTASSTSELLDRRDSSASAQTGSASSSSSSSSSSIPEASDRYQGRTFYTAQLLVPISLPRKKHFVPTFHSCLVSRVYILHLHLATQSPGQQGASLKVPVQISAEGRSAARVSEDAAWAAAEVDEVLTPRLVGRVGEERDGLAERWRAQEAPPPEYGQQHGAPVRVC